PGARLLRRKGCFEPLTEGLSLIVGQGGELQLPGEARGLRSFVVSVVLPAAGESQQAEEKHRRHRPDLRERAHLQPSSHHGEKLRRRSRRGMPCSQFRLLVRKTSPPLANRFTVSLSC